VLTLYRRDNAVTLTPRLRAKSIFDASRWQQIEHFVPLFFTHSPSRKKAPRLHPGSPCVALCQVLPNFIDYLSDLMRVLQRITTGYVLVVGATRCRKRRD
jgi:hypothetical protein